MVSWQDDVDAPQERFRTKIGNEELVFRLGQLESRQLESEKEMKKLANTCTELKTNMDNTATKSELWKSYAVVFLASLAST